MVQRRGGDVGAASYGSRPAAVGGAAGAPAQSHGPFGVATRGFQGVPLTGVHGAGSSIDSTQGLDILHRQCFPPWRCPGSMSHPFRSRFDL